MKRLTHITLALLFVGVHPLLPRSCSEACAMASSSASDLEPVADKGASCCGPTCCCGPEERSPDVLAAELAPCAGNAAAAATEESASGAVLVTRVGDTFTASAKTTHPSATSDQVQPESAPDRISVDLGRPPPSSHRYDLLCTLLI